MIERLPRAFNFKPLEIETMAKKQNAKPAKEAPKAEHKPVMTPLEEAKLQQFKRMFPRECELLIKEFKAANGQ